ncbi:glycosyltransferase family 9 protein [Agromyces salentinus]|uniref:Glycosyltransferase family 9 protein n=1 Tax=Agromyces salentinus TaxID=269421 RepID=A0ABP4Z8K1_9MICO|nr:glycosyltransferase family 9 protein [Agromyces salentinus]
MTRRVLVARLDSVGDVLLCGPAIRAVAASAEVHLLAGPAGAPAGRLLPGVRSVHVWDCPWITNPPRPAADTAAATAELMALLDAVRPSEAVILTSYHQSPLPLALLLRQHGVERIAGASVDYPGSLLDVRLRPGEDFPESQSEATRALAIAAAAGFALPPGDTGRLAVRAAAPVPGLVGDSPYVVVHPGATAPARTMPVAQLVAVVAALVEAGIRVVVTGSASESGSTARVAGRSALDLGGATDLPSLAAVLAGADAVVVGNTGAAHLAAAVGTPVVSLFSPVVDERCWRPFGVPTILLGRTDTACAASRARECPTPGHPCLSDIEPREVVDAVLAVGRFRGDRVRASTPADLDAGHRPEEAVA